MKPLPTLLAVIAVLALAIRRGLFGDARLIASNTLPANVGTHDGAVNRLPDAAISTRNLLYKVGSDADHIAVAGANDLPLGTVDDEATSAEVSAGNQFLSVKLLGKGGTKRMVASEAISAGAAVYGAASGKVSTLSASAGTYYKVGIALTAAAADGDVIEVADCEPQKRIVFAQTQDALTDSTGGTANTTLAAVTDTSATDQSGTINNNFADLAAQLAKIKADVANALTR